MKGLNQAQITKRPARYYSRRARASGVLAANSLGGIKGAPTGHFNRKYPCRAKPHSFLTGTDFFVCSKCGFTTPREHLFAQERAKNERMVNRFPWSKLTSRQFRALKEKLINRLTFTGVADRLKITYHTASKHYFSALEILHGDPLDVELAMRAMKTMSRQPDGSYKISTQFPQPNGGDPATQNIAPDGPAASGNEIEAT
jgi:hypothetical protein